jgi:hypothetical protein
MLAYSLYLLSIREPEPDTYKMHDVPNLINDKKYSLFL